MDLFQMPAPDEMLVSWDIDADIICCVQIMMAQFQFTSFANSE